MGSVSVSKVWRKLQGVVGECLATLMIKPTSAVITPMGAIAKPSIRKRIPPEVALHEPTPRKTPRIAAATPPHVISSPILMVFTAAIMPEVRFSSKDQTLSRIPAAVADVIARGLLNAGKIVTGRPPKIVAPSGDDWLGEGMADSALRGEQCWLLYFMFSTG
jgi:hypothetical protein